MKNLLFFLIITITACQADKGEGVVQQIDGAFHVKVLPELARDGKLSEFFEEDIDYVWLKDDQEEASVAVIHRLFFYKDRYYLLDEDICLCFYIFDDQGNFIKQIKRYGEGPGNYLSPSSFQLYKGNISLFEPFLRKWLVFDWEGNWIEDIPSPVRASEMEFDSKGNSFFYKGFNDGIDKSYQVWVLDEKLENTHYFFPFDQDVPIPMANRRVFTSIEEGMVYANHFDDTISIFKNNSWKAHVVFDFGENGIRKKEVSKLDIEDYMHMVNEKRPMFFRNLGFVNDRWLFNPLIFKDMAYSSILDKQKYSYHLIKRPLIIGQSLPAI